MNSKNRRGEMKRAMHDAAREARDIYHLTCIADNMLLYEFEIPLTDTELIDKTLCLLDAIKDKANTLNHFLDGGSSDEDDEEKA